MKTRWQYVRALVNAENYKELMRFYRAHAYTLIPGQIIIHTTSGRTLRLTR